MKKSLFLVVVILVAIAILPVIGNSFMKKMINDRLVELKSNGLVVKKDISLSAYLYSSRHFEFTVEDTSKFINYLNTFSDKQIPPYVNSMIKGAIVGMDVGYNNLPFAKGLSVDIYPLTLSDEMSDSIKDEDLEFYNHINKFLSLKGILYHINYDVTNRDFDGYVKDINEAYTLKDKTNMKLVVAKAVFKGSGYLIAPDRLSTLINRVNISIKNQNIDLVFSLDKLKSASSFASVSTYLSSIDLRDMKLSFKDKDENISVSTSNIKVNFSANTQGEKAEFNTKSSIKELRLLSSKDNIHMQNLKYDIAVNGIDKASLESLRVVVSKSKSNHQLNSKVIKSGIHLVSHGLQVDVPELSVENITLNKTENLKGFSIKLALKIKEDKEFLTKLNISPILLIDDIDLHLNIKLSNEIYNFIMKDIPMANSFSNYAVIDASDTIFDMVFSKSNLKINGKDI